MGSQGNLYCCLLSDSVLGFSILTPMLFCWFNFLGMKGVMELYEIRHENKIAGEDIFYILPLFLGSTTIQGESAATGQ